MARKRIYRAVNVNELKRERVRERAGRHPIVGIDVAKEDFYAAVMNQNQEVVVTVSWSHPEQTPAFVQLLSDLEVKEVAMEPSGTYGDALRVLILGAGIDVYRVSPKWCHDMAEVYDGVPSLHDGKSAAIVAKLHADGRSEPWPVRSDHERRLTAALRKLEIHEKVFRQNRNRLANLLARHWPELTETLDLGTATLLELLAEYGGPAAVREHERAAAGLMRKVGGRFLAADKVDTVIRCAGSTLGVPQLEEERHLVQSIASEARRAQKLARRARAQVEKLSDSLPPTQQMSQMVGKKTAAVLVAAVGDPRKYDCASAYQKSLGLNLKERSSGKHKGALKLTKRGPGIARQYLHMAALRLINGDRIVSAWYARKVRRDGGRIKMKAVTAVVRKLSKALWHVAHGAQFDAALLFDTRRLGLT